MIQVNLAKAKSSFSEYASRAAYTNEHNVITKRGKPFVALISVKDLEFLNLHQIQKESHVLMSQQFCMKVKLTIPFKSAINVGSKKI